MTNLAHLPWDSEFFGYRVATVAGDTLDDAGAAAVAQQADSESVHCLYFRASAADAASWAAAINVGFEPIDVRVELARTLAPAAGRVEGLPSADRTLLPQLHEISATAFEESRFFKDKRFGAGAAERLFRIWTERGVTDEGWFTLVARSSDASTVGGFISGSCSGPAGRIQLFAVRPEARRQGFGSELIRQAIQTFSSRGVQEVTVITQGGNVPAIATYERHGFTVRSVMLWFHRWTRRPSAVPPRDCDERPTERKSNTEPQQ